MVTKKTNFVTIKLVTLLVIAAATMSSSIFGSKMHSGSNNNRSGVLRILSSYWNRSSGNGRESSVVTHGGSSS